MIKLITAIMAFATLVPAPGFKEITKQPLADNRAAIVETVPHRATEADGDYVVEGGEANAYEELKKALDKRFEYMFELKENIDKLQNQTNEMWEEYHVLREKYNRELKRIVALWLTATQYGDNAYGGAYGHA